MEESEITTLFAFIELVESELPITQYWSRYGWDDAHIPLVQEVIEIKNKYSKGLDETIRPS